MNVKICGLTSVAAVNMVASAGARYVGFVFFPKSPRHIDLITAAKLAQATPVGVAKVALTVNASDADLDAIIEAMPLDMLQLHGKESPDRVAQIRSRYGLPVMKAMGIADESDLPALLDYAAVADQILVDAKPPRNATLPGGNGLSFDWRLVHNRRWPVPWMLAGGLTPDNVAEAIRLTGATQVDVSSGVESSPGIKDAALVKAFVKAAI